MIEPDTRQQRRGRVAEAAVVAHMHRPRLGLADGTGSRVGADPGVEPDRVGAGLSPFHYDPVEMLQPQPNYWLIKHPRHDHRRPPTGKAAQLNNHATRAPDSRTDVAEARPKTPT
jgi:hypothetical protein